MKHTTKGWQCLKSKTSTSLYFFVRAILFNRIVQNSPSYESYREMDLGGIAEKGVAEYYNTLSPIILSITILAFIFLFITGFIVRKKSKSLIQQQKFKNKPLVLLIIGMSLLLFMMTIFSMIMLVLISNFKVSYYWIMNLTFLKNVG